MDITNTTPPAPAAGEGAPVPAGAAPAPVVNETPAAPPPETPPAAAPEAPKEPEAKATEPTPAAIEVKLPEGVEAVPALMDALKGAAKDSAGAQALVDAYAAHQQALHEQATAAREQQKKQWVEQVKADKDLGGPAFDANFAKGVRALEKFGTPALNEILTSTGLSHHPEFFRFVVGVGRAMAEDPGVGTSAPSTQARSPEGFARALYGNSPDLK